MSDLDSRILENSDGTLIVRLLQPITVGGETHERVTIRRVTGRIARSTIYDGLDENGGGSVTLPKLIDLANALSAPSNAADDVLCEADVLALATAAAKQLGKFRGADGNGSASSGSLAPGSTSLPQSSSS